MKVIGFTGTQHGMSPTQIQDLTGLLIREQDNTPDHIVVFHHGDCIGADAQAHAIAHGIACSIVIHPPICAKKRAFCGNGQLMPAETYIVRNHDIVDDSEYLIAAPHNPQQEELRSGTWSTIRYARKMGKKVVILGA